MTPKKDSINKNNDSSLTRNKNHLDPEDGKVSEYEILINGKSIIVEIQQSKANRHIKKIIKEQGKTGRINKLFIKQFLNILIESLEGISSHRPDAKISSLVYMLHGCTGWEALNREKGIHIFEK